MIVRGESSYDDGILNEACGLGFEIYPEVEAGGWMVDGDIPMFLEWAENEGISFIILED